MQKKFENFDWLKYFDKMDTASLVALAKRKDNFFSNIGLTGIEQEKLFKVRPNKSKLKLELQATILTILLGREDEETLLDANFIRGLDPELLTVLQNKQELFNTGNTGNVQKLIDQIEANRLTRPPTDRKSKAAFLYQSEEPPDIFNDSPLTSTGRGQHQSLSSSTDEKHSFQMADLSDVSRNLGHRKRSRSLSDLPASSNDSVAEKGIRSRSNMVSLENEQSRATVTQKPKPKQEAQTKPVQTKPVQTQAAPAASASPPYLPPPEGTVEQKSAAVENYKRELRSKIRLLENALPALSETNRGIVLEKMKSLEAAMVRMDELKRFGDHDDAYKIYKANYDISVPSANNGISISGVFYQDYIDQNHPQPNSHKAYLLEKRKYEGKLVALNQRADAVEALEAEIVELEASLKAMKSTTTPSVTPPGVLANKEAELLTLQKQLQEDRLMLALDKERAASRLISLTKTFGGYKDLTKAASLHMYVGGGLGFETLVMPRSSATKIGLLDEANDEASVSIGTEGYVLKTKLASNEVVVSTKSYTGGHPTVIVSEPGVVRDKSPHPERATPAQKNEKAIQMVMSIVTQYNAQTDKSKPVIIRGGDHELRGQIHAYLLALKYAPENPSMMAVMGSLFKGKPLPTIDISKLKVLSDVGPAQYGAETPKLDWVKRGMGVVQSVDQAQKSRDLAFVDSVLGSTKGKPFEEQKAQYKGLREATRGKDQNLTFFDDAPPRPK